jgi:hypothetical protein
MTAIFTAMLAALLGVLQSLAIGRFAGRWDGGTGLLWAVVLGVVTFVVATILPRFGVVTAFGAPLLVAGYSAVSIVLDGRRNASRARAPRG